MKKAMRAAQLAILGVTVLVSLVLHPVSSRCDASINLRLLSSISSYYTGDTYGTYYVSGIIQNDGPANAGSITIRVKLWRFGMMVAQGTGNAYLPVVPPGQTTPFEISANYLFANLVEDYSVELSGSATNQTPYEPLHVESTYSYLWSSAVRLLTGFVRNVSADYLRGAASDIRIAYMDAEGKLLELSSAYLPPFSHGYISPGEAAPFGDVQGDSMAYERVVFWCRSEPLSRGMYPLDLTATVDRTEWYTNPYGYEYYRIYGRATNHSAVPARSPLLFFIFYDGEGHILWYASDDTALQAGVAAGGTSQYVVELSRFNVPDAYSRIEVRCYTTSTTSVAPPGPTPTHTLSPTQTLTPTNSPPPTQTSTSTNTPTDTLTPTQTLSPTSTATRTQTPTVTPTATVTPTPVALVFLPCIMRR